MVSGFFSLPLRHSHDLPLIVVSIGESMVSECFSPLFHHNYDSSFIAVSNGWLR
jgi:hypothetical protein